MRLKLDSDSGKDKGLGNALHQWMNSQRQNHKQACVSLYILTLQNISMSFNHCKKNYAGVVSTAFSHKKANAIMFNHHKTFGGSDL